VQPNRHVRPEFLAAFSELASRIASTLTQVSKRTLPVKMYVAGGAALHFYTGHRLSDDIDASFSHRIALPDDLEVSYKGADGTAELLYFDRQYNDTLGLLHEDAYDDSIPLKLDGIDAGLLDVRLLSPLDLAVSKLGPIGAEMKKLVADPAHIDSVLADGSARAQVIAAETMKAVKDIVGFVRR